jgi:hypothetical protein
MRVAFKAIRQESQRTLDELSGTNCDRRFLAYFERLVTSADREFAQIEPVEIGINLTIVESAMGSVKAELADSVYGHLIGVVLNVKQFISNFRDWSEYNNNSLDVEVSDILLAEAIAIERTLDHQAFGDDVREQSHYYASMAELVPISIQGKSLRSSFLLGIQNVISVVTREALKFIRLAGTKVVAKIAGGVGTLAVAWIITNIETLSRFAASHPSFSWMTDVLEFIRRSIIT